MSTKKTIKINPEFFKRNSKTPSSKRKKKLKPVIPKTMKPNNIKKQLIQKIKRHQKNALDQKNSLNKEEENFKNNFSESLDYLQKMITEKKKKKKKRSTIKKQMNKKNTIPVLNIQTATGIATPSFPQTGVKTAIKLMPSVGSVCQIPKLVDFDTLDNQILPNTLLQNKTPSWGCLKNGKLPTYSQYKKTLKKRSNMEKIKLAGSKLAEEIKIDNSVKIVDKTMFEKPIGEIKFEKPVGKIKFEKPVNEIKFEKPVNEIKFEKPVGKIKFEKPVGKIKFDSPLDKITDIPKERQTKLSRLKDKFLNNNVPTVNTNSFITKRKTIKKYKLGKNKKKNNIGVLIKSHKTRKKIKDEIGILKQKSIAEIKLYLKKHNIIKIGSLAPDDVLRQLYNDSRLAGDIYNNSSEILMHNYMNEQ